MFLKRWCKFTFQNKIFYVRIFIAPVRATCLAHFVLDFCYPNNNNNNSIYDYFVFIFYKSV